MHSPKSERAPRSRRQRAIISIAKLSGIVLALYGAVCLYLVGMETRLIFPGAYFRSGPSFAQAESDKAEPFVYTAGDGLRLRGRIMLQPDAQRLVVFFHGNGERADSLDPYLLRIADAFQATVIAAEYRGYQDEHSTPNEAGVIADSIAAVDAVCQRFSVEPGDLVLYGRSLGGGCAAAVAARRGAKAIVLERTFDRLVDVAALKYPWIPVRMLMSNRFDSVARLASYRGPVIQVHGDADTLIPIKNARTLFDSIASERKRWITVPNMSHIGVLPQSTLERIAALLDKMLERPVEDAHSSRHRSGKSMSASLSQLIQKDGRGDRYV